MYRKILAVIVGVLALGSLSAQNTEERYYRVDIDSSVQRVEAANVGEIVADYGSFLVLRSRQAAQLAVTGRAYAIDTRIHARNLAFEPLENFAAADGLRRNAVFSSLDAAGGDFLVQFDAPIKGEWLAAIKSAGLEPIQYFPNQAYLVRANAESARAAMNLPHVRYVGAYHPAYRLPAELSWVFGTIGKNSYGHDRRALYSISLNKITDPEAFKANLTKVDARPILVERLANNYFDVLRAELPPDAVSQIAQLPGVIAIDPYYAPQKEDERSSQIISGNFSAPTVLDAPGYNPLTQFGVDGTNVTVAVVDDGVGIPGDGGFYVTAANNVNGPLRGATAGAAGHGHLQSSIIAGAAPFSTLDPLGYNYGLGVAPKAHIINIPLLRAGYSGADGDTTNDTFVTAGPNGVRGALSNNSWGAGTNGNAYGTRAALWDGLVRDATSDPLIDPLLIVFSAGNQGTAGLTQPKTAKNVISVAASENVRPGENSSGGSTGAADNLEQLPDFSSRGPAADGRIKPDITAPGDAIAGGRSGPDVLFGNIDSFHRRSSGTSHAAPQIAGVAALFIQKWKAANSGNNPSPAMSKAAIINSGVDMTGTGATAGIPNGAEGWGRVNMRHIFTPPSESYYLDQTQTLTDPGQSFEWQGAVASGARDLRVTLVWTDPPGATDPALVNDLDLQVTVGSTVYRGNVFSAGVSTTGGTANNRDNVEKILLTGVPSGTAVKINVRASAINGDGVLGNADTTDQNFAIVCTNCVQDPGFTINTATTLVSACAADGIRRTIDIAQVLNFTTPVTFSATGIAAPANFTFTPNPAPTPGQTTLVGALAGVSSGEYTVAITGTAGSIVRNINLPVFVAAGVTVAPSLTAPADAATGVAASPTLTWAAQPNAFDYLVEISTSPNFTSILRSEVTRATSYTSTALDFSTQYYWRVSARNACGGFVQGEFANGFEDPRGGSVASLVRSFTTVAAPPAPGDCPVGTTTNTIFTENMESGAAGWVAAIVSGTNNWTISNAFPNSPANAYRAIAPGAPGDTTLTTPTIAIPASGSPRLQFSQLRGLEPNGAAGCYDAGMLEVSVGGGAFTQITTGITGLAMTGPIATGSNPAAGRTGWCGTGPHAITAVDLVPYAGQSIQLRFRVTADVNTANAEGWNIDDVRVKTCN